MREIPGENLSFLVLEIQPFMGQFSPLFLLKVFAEIWDFTDVSY